MCAVAYSQWRKTTNGSHGAETWSSHLGVCTLYAIRTMLYVIRSTYNVICYTYNVYVIRITYTV